MCRFGAFNFYFCENRRTIYDYDKNSTVILVSSWISGKARQMLKLYIQKSQMMEEVSHLLLCWWGEISTVNESHVTWDDTGRSKWQIKITITTEREMRTVCVCVCVKGGEWDDGSINKALVNWLRFINAAAFQFTAKTVSAKSWMLFSHAEQWKVITTGASRCFLQRAEQNMRREKKWFIRQNVWTEKRFGFYRNTSLKFYHHENVSTCISKTLFTWHGI